MSKENIGALTDQKLGLVPRVNYAERKISFWFDKIFYRFDVYSPGYDEGAARGRNALVTISVPTTFCFISRLKDLWSIRIYFDENKLGDDAYIKEIATMELENYKRLKMRELLKTDSLFS